jgi:hypothetical protein
MDGNVSIVYLQFVDTNTLRIMESLIKILNISQQWPIGEVDLEIVPLWREMVYFDTAQIFLFKEKWKKRKNIRIIRYDMDIYLDRKNKTIDISLYLFHFSLWMEIWMNVWLWILYISVKKEFLFEVEHFLFVRGYGLSLISITYEIFSQS